MHKSAFFKENHFSLIGGLFVLFRMDFFSIPAINEAYANIRVSSRFFVQAGHETTYACDLFTMVGLIWFHLHFLAFTFVYQFNSRIGVLVQSYFAND